jgi:hypothetical protein
MKKLIAAMLVLAIVALLAPALFAGSVYDRSVVVSRLVKHIYVSRHLVRQFCGVDPFQLFTRHDQKYYNYS